MVVIHKRFLLKGFDWENFGVLDWWSLMGGGRLPEVITHGGLTLYPSGC